MSGLRERKKAKTHAAIQEHAMRLFAEQGYEATTVEQIAAAAEVSPSTLFRYFPTKQDIVLHDALDPLLFAAFGEQPPELSRSRPCAPRWPRSSAVSHPRTWLSSTNARN